MAALERMSVLSAAAAYAAVESHSSTSREVLNRAFSPTLNWAILAPPPKLVPCTQLRKSSCATLRQKGDAQSLGKGGDFTSVKFSKIGGTCTVRPTLTHLYALTPMLSHVLSGFLRLRSLFECCMKTRAEHADYDPLMAIPQRPSSTSRRHAAASCERNFRCVRQHAPPSFGALDRPVQSHELAHDPAARSWPRPRARGARHLWTLWLCSDATAFSRSALPGDDPLTGLTRHRGP
jgi:hypothetical protein